LYKLK